MKKLSFVLLFSLIAFFGFSQEFYGIKIEGTRQQLISKYVAKGFVVQTNPAPTSTGVSLKGKVNGKDLEIIIINSPISKLVWKLTVYFPEEVGWYSLKSCYFKYLDVLKEKYGEPESSYSNFVSPYYEGDGYEMSAVSLKKCNYCAFWGDMVLSISEFKQVSVMYQNNENAEISQREHKKMNLDIY